MKPTDLIQLVANRLAKHADGCCCDNEHERKQIASVALDAIALQIASELGSLHVNPSATRSLLSLFDRPND